MQNIGVKFDDENKFALLNVSFSIYFKPLKVPFIYLFIYRKEDSITLEEVQFAIRTKEITNMKVLKG